MGKVVPLEDRFWAKVDKSGECWRWTAATDSHGYGQIVLPGTPVKKAPAHRLSWALANGPIPDGLFIDHVCHNTLCVRPEHLRLATNKQNLENRGAQANSKSGVRGVNWHKAAGKWRAVVKHNMVHHYIGLFASIDDAEAAVKAKRNELFTHNDTDRIAS